MKKHTGDSYDQLAEKYADDQENKPWSTYFERPGILNFLPDLAHKDVLDAGCGPGFYTRYMVDQGAHVTAFDLNPFFVEHTKQRTEQRATIYQANLAEPLTFAADSSFDFIVCILVLHYLKDWQPTLAEFNRVLRPGGRLIFSTHHPFTDLEFAPNDDYFATTLIEDEWKIGKMRFYRRPLSQISQDLLQTGFIIEEIAEPQPIKPPDHVTFNSYERSLKKPMRLLVRAQKTTTGR